MPRRDILDNPQEMPEAYTTHKGENGVQYRFWKSEDGWTWRRYAAGRVVWGTLAFDRAVTPGAVLDMLIDLKGEPNER